MVVGFQTLEESFNLLFLFIILDHCAKLAIRIVRDLVDVTCIALRRTDAVEHPMLVIVMVFHINDFIAQFFQRAAGEMVAGGILFP